jgi:hypothetical protein
MTDSLDTTTDTVAELPHIDPEPAVERVQALGRTRVVGLMLPERDSSLESLLLATVQEAAKTLGYTPEQVGRAFGEIEQKRSTTRYLQHRAILAEPVSEIENPTMHRPRGARLR